jgi:GxxExxY protein
MTENQIATIIVDAAFKIHKTLGPGLLESVYQATLSYELQKQGLVVVQQVGLPVYYEEVKLEIGFRVDLIVGGKVVVEIKSVDSLAAIHG